MAYSESILTLMYDFLLYLIPQLSKFPRDQKFNLGDRIQNLAHDILDDFITTYYSSFSKEKIEQLRKANIKLERLRYSIRLSHDLKVISNEKYGVISRKINEIGGTLGNWRILFTPKGCNVLAEGNALWKMAQYKIVKAPTGRH